MPVFAEPAFVAMVAICFVLMQLRLPISRSLWFGVLNAAAVTVLFGWRPLAALIAVSIVYWAILAGVRHLQNSARGALVRRILAAVPYLLYGSVALLFIMHKSLLEPGNDFANLFPFGALSEIARTDTFGPGILTLQLLALSYVALRLVDFVRAGLDGAPLLHPLALAGYLAPFFMTPSGPVNVYVEHVKMDTEQTPPPTAAHFIDCSFLVVSGYFMKFVVAQLFSIFIVGVSGDWPTATFGDTALFLIFVFLEFLGYSLIALGVGRLLGVPTPINFNHPYFATSVGDFWVRWHVSLGAFVRRNLYTPAQVAMIRRVGRKNRDLAYLTNLLALWLPFAFVGIWHRFSWNFLLWGVCVGAIVALEKLVRDRIWPHLGWSVTLPAWAIRPLAVCYTLSVVVVSLHIAAGEFTR